MRVGAMVVGCLLAAVAVGCGGEVTVHEDLGSLQAALDGAGPGDTVRAGSVRLEGPLRVPPGVTLLGAGQGETIVVAPTDMVGVVAETGGAAETRVRGLTVESAGRAGILVTGDGAIRVEEVDVTATRGIGIGAEGSSWVRIADVTLAGPVTRESADTILEPTPDSHATHGLVLVDVATAQLEDVQIDGFARIGAVFVDSGVSWARGGADGNLGTGVMASGGNTSLSSLGICDTLQGLHLIPAYGAVFADDVTVDTSDLTICDGDAYGAIFAGARARHENLVATGNGNAALWAQGSDMLEVVGAGSRLSDNRFAGVVAVDSANVHLSDATVEDTEEVVRVAGEVGTIEVGDGIQLVRSTTGVVLSDLTLSGNQRAGILVELGGGSTSGLSIDGVAASATGDALGVVAQGGMLESGWDGGVARMGAAEGNDASFLSSGDVLDVVGVVAPTDLPAADGFATDGLSHVGVVAPTD